MVPPMDNRLVGAAKQLNASLKTAFHVHFRDIMAARGDSYPHTLNRVMRTGVFDEM